MTLDEFYDFYKGCVEKGLTKISVDMEETEDGTFVVKTKETYFFECEDECLDPAVEKIADELINSVRLDEGFCGATKKAKEGKCNKSGEVTKAASYTVVITRTH